MFVEGAEPGDALEVKVLYMLSSLFVRTRSSMKRPRAAPLAVVILLTGMAPCAAGQPAKGAPGVEVWGSLSAVPTGQSGTITSSYSPAGLQELVNTATQTLTIDRNTSAGFQGGANFFLTPHAGLQIVVDRSSAGVSGRNTPYERLLLYIRHITPTSPPITVQRSHGSRAPRSRRGARAGGPGVVLRRIPQTRSADSGSFYFSNPSQVEVLVRVLNSCAVNSRYQGVRQPRHVV